MRNLMFAGVLLTLFPQFAAGQGPHVWVEMADQGLRITNSGTLRLSTDAHLTLTSSSMTFEDPTSGLGPLGGGRSVLVAVDPQLGEGACSGSFDAEVDGRNVPRLTYGPFAYVSPDLRVDMHWGEADTEGWRVLRVSLEAAEELTSLAVLGEFPDAWQVESSSVDCGTEGVRGGGGCHWPSGFHAGSVGVRLKVETSGKFGIHTRSGDGCVRGFEGALR